jgi:hypothetical protein
VWLEDYRLSCHAGGATDDLFVIKNLTLYLGDFARTWLEHLPRDKINDWTNLHRVFVGNIQGTYMCPGKQWELRNCKHQPGESLCEYIWRFSKRYIELPGATDNNAISAFQNGTTCTSLIHLLKRRMPRTIRELLDITSNHAVGEEAVTATLNTPQGKGKQVVDHSKGTSAHFKKKKKKKNDKRHCDDNLIATMERKTSRPKGNPTKPAPSKDHFEKLLDESCPHHEVPVKHSLWGCRLMKNYVNGSLKPRMADQPKKGGPPPDNDDGKRAAYSGEDGAVHMISGKTLEAAQEAHPTRSFQHRCREAVLSKVVGVFDNLRPRGPSQPRASAWILPTSGSSPIQIQKGPQGTDRWGSEMNVLYASTLDGMGISRSQLRPSTAPFHGVIPEMEALPIGQIDLPVTFGDMRTFCTKTLTFEVVGFSGTYHVILGRPAYTKFMAMPN